MTDWRHRRDVSALLLAGTLLALFACVESTAARSGREAVLEPTARARRDTVLAWDDGDYGTIYDGTSGQQGMQLAVEFQAPPWADFVTEIHYFIMDDPYSPSTLPFTAFIWKPSPPEMLPIQPGTPLQNSGSGYLEDAWLQLPLPSPVDISDNDEYPDRVFFVGLGWNHSWNPVIGLDTDEPIDYRSFRWNWVQWEILLADAMVRAVVSDGASPVERDTWTRIKAMFR
jgi:hypothetical protein